MRQQHPSPGELIRLWLVWEHQHQRLNASGMARTIGVSQVRVHHWMTGRNRIPDSQWSAIAEFFDFDTPEAFIAAARELLKKRGKALIAAGARP